jgi:hypothetical protein
MNPVDRLVNFDSSAWRTPGQSPSLPPTFLASQLRVAHVAPDYSTWWWRDNTPYTGDRQVERKDALRNLIERMAKENKVELR